jgi:hypothetical protein
MGKTAKAAAIGVRRAWLGVGAPIIALVAIVTGLAIAALASLARDQDAAFEHNSAMLVESGLESRARTMGAVGLDYANWNAAFENVSTRWNEQWIEENFYSSVADAMVLFRQNGASRFVWANDAYQERAVRSPKPSPKAGRACRTCAASRARRRRPTPSRTLMRGSATIC